MIMPKHAKSFLRILAPYTLNDSIQYLLKYIELPTRTLENARDHQRNVTAPSQKKLIGIQPTASPKHHHNIIESCSLPTLLYTSFHTESAEATTHVGHRH